MEDIQKFINEFSADALEANTKIAGVALITDSGTATYQTENFDLKDQGSTICQVSRGLDSFKLNDFKYSVTESSPAGVIAENCRGMGWIVITVIKGGFLVVFAMPGADAKQVLSFLNDYASKCEGLL